MLYEYDEIFNWKPCMITLRSGPSTRMDEEQ